MNLNSLYIGTVLNNSDISDVENEQPRGQVKVLINGISTTSSGGDEFGFPFGKNLDKTVSPKTKELVDDYEMMDGSQFDWNNATHAADPFADRDPRFYATVMYDGSGWKPRPGDVTGIDPVDQIQTGIYDDGAGEFINGVDTRESVIENWNGNFKGVKNRDATL